MTKQLTHELLLQTLRYEPETGLFYRRHDVPGRKAGLTGTVCGPYLVVGIAGKNWSAHRLAWYYMTGVWPEVCVEHRNGDGHDNRWDNLRLATRTQNSWNKTKQKDNTSGYKGVMRRNDRWVAVIRWDGNKKHLGTFDTPKEASAAYDAASKVHHGEFSGVYRG